MALTPFNQGPLSHVSYALWTVQGLNLRPPACKTGALPTELTAQKRGITSFRELVLYSVLYDTGIEPASVCCATPDLTVQRGGATVTSHISVTCRTALRPSAPSLTRRFRRRLVHTSLRFALHDPTGRSDSPSLHARFVSPGHSRRHG